MHGTRGWLLALLVLPTAIIAGCSQQEEPPLAQPTNVIHVPTRNVTVAPPAPVVDFDDPGLVLNGSWQVGDEWDYASNRSAVRQVLVEARFTYRGLPHLLVTESTQRPSEILDVRRHIIQAQDWLRINVTDEQGFTQQYNPGVPLRLNRNASYDYNLSLKGRTFAETQIATVAATTRYPTNATWQFPWGFVETARIEHRIVARPTGTSDLQRSLVVHYVAAEFLNDVKIVESGETWTLTAAKVGDFRRGKLISER